MLENRDYFLVLRFSFSRQLVEKETIINHTHFFLADLHTCFCFFLQLIIVLEKKSSQSLLLQSDHFEVTTENIEKDYNKSYNIMYTHNSPLTVPVYAFAHHALRKIATDNHLSLTPSISITHRSVGTSPSFEFFECQ